MQTKDPSLYPAVKSKGNTAKVFFIFSCIRFVVGIVSICGIMGVLTMGTDNFFEDKGAFISIFAVSLISNVITFTIGVMSIVKYKEAQKLYSTLTPKPGAVNGSFNSAHYGNGANNNGTNYANPSNTSYNTNNTGAQGSYQVNVHTNDPAQLRSSTGDQSPFEAPPPNYTKYNYVNTADYQRGITFPIQNNPQGSSPQNVRQSAPMRSESSTPSYNPPPNSSSANVNNSAAVNNAKPRQYVSQMPEVTPLPASKPSAAANAPANTASAPQNPVVPVILPVPPEIKREATVRCKHCGVTNKDGDKFCTFCGKSLSE
ncbi:MAG: zinc ribbon domain-containing protein [Ruminiclostridium sp.]|nr:zinc ribbon domain-containing protein [Ruminiclostridium sp.]